MSSTSDTTTEGAAAPEESEVTAEAPVETEATSEALAQAPEAAEVTEAPAAPKTEAELRELIEAHDLALAALREITPEQTLGKPAGFRIEDGNIVSLLFENQMLGYPNWFWTVSLAQLDGEAPTVLEAELLPGDGALLAPEWVPWATRLAEYQAAQAA